jgi:hypothetical protein
MSLAPDEYARAIESHLCQKNDGHLIRIVGPAFERVVSWAERGIPLKVALAGVDRYFARYYRKGPRRRPVRVEFCEADVLDAFDEWRRAVGVSLVAPDADGGPVVEEPVPAAPRARRSLRSHIEAALARLTVLRGSDRLGGGPAEEALAGAVRALEPLLKPAEHARGDERQRILDTLADVDRQLLDALDRSLPVELRAECAAEAVRELEPFRARLAPEAYAQARRAVVARLVREHLGVPEIRA